MNLLVFSSNRALREFYLKSDEAFLPDARNLKGFFNEITFVKGKVKIPNALRTLVLYRAIKRVNVEKLGFDKTFLRFLEHSKFFFDFFDELESAQISIDEIDISDTYGDYDDHLRLLSRVYEAYKGELKARNLYDMSEIPSIYEPFLRYYEHITIFIDGILSHRDFALLKAASAHSSVEIIFEYTRFNAFIFDKILPKPLEMGHKYRYDIASDSVKSAESLAPKMPQITLYSFAMRINQAMLVIAKINEWLKNGAESIAIVLPSEDFAPILRLFDTARNLNYAMGLDNDALGRKIAQLQGDFEPGTAHSKWQNVKDFLGDFADEFADFEYFAEFFEDLEYAEIGAFLEQNLSKIDDISGGKIKVIGILETRGVAFDKVIIVDFNEDFAPKLGDNDLFLNTTIRRRAGLPTLQDKENLQRHYYHSLLSHANEAHIAFCATSQPSTLLNDFGLSPESAVAGENLWRFFPSHAPKPYIEDIITAPPRFSYLTASKLKVFNDCARKFYFAHYEHFGADEPSPSAAFGSFVHDYLAQDLPPADLARGLESHLLSSAKTPIERLKMEIYARRMKPFIQSLEKSEIWRKECPFEAKIGGFVFKGKIDRIDRVGGEICIIDYKLKERFDVKKEGFLQLLIYKKALECDEECCGMAINALYYDILTNATYAMSDESEKEACELLESSLARLSQREIDFAKTEDRGVCHYCDYKYLCNRY